jgi:hypothetical protein
MADLAHKVFQPILTPSSAFFCQFINLLNGSRFKFDRIYGSNKIFYYKFPQRIVKLYFVQLSALVPLWKKIRYKNLYRDYNLKYIDNESS